MANHYIPFYVGDYLRDTRSLSTLEHGAYMLLIMEYWSTGEPLKNSENFLKKITQTSTYQWKNISKNIALRYRVY